MQQKQRMLATEAVAAKLQIQQQQKQQETTKAAAEEAKAAAQTTKTAAQTIKAAAAAVLVMDGEKKGGIHSWAIVFIEVGWGRLMGARGLSRPVKLTLSRRAVAKRSKLARLSRDSPQEARKK